MKKFLFIIFYWLLSLTWNGILTLIGIIAMIVALALGGKPHKNGCSIIIEIGHNWGGINLGAISLSSIYSTKNMDWFNETRCHEFGHSIQGLIFGPLQIFIVAIPSAIRYWYQRIRDSKHLPNKDYDDIWFEYTASSWGTKFINWLESQSFVYDYIRPKDR